MNLQSVKSRESEIAVFNLTALWGLSEAFIGGILHTLRIPFKGMIIGSIAVLIITLLSTFSASKGTIIKACFVTIIIKALISPYSPPAAYLAVLLQGLLGELFFTGRKNILISSVMLGIVTSVYSSVQRIIVVTILFGQDFWITVNQFPSFIMKEFSGSPGSFENLNLSLIIIIVYTGIHVIFGFIAGVFSYRISRKVIPDSLNVFQFSEEFLKELSVKITADSVSKPSKSGNKFFKFSRFVIYGLLILALISSYIFTDKGYFDSKSIWVMIIRSFLIMFLWLKVFSPLIMSVFRKKFLTERNVYSDQAGIILSLIPHFKILTVYCWKISSEKNKTSGIIKKLSDFAVMLLSVVITYDFRKPDSVLNNYSERNLKTSSLV